MKVILKLLLACTFITFMACEKSTETPANQITLGGNWNMKNVSGGLMGLNLDYNSGEVIWVFNSTTRELSVTNNISTTGPKSIYARYATGVYKFYTVTQNSLEYLYVDSTEIGIITIGTNSLLLDDGVLADGFLTRFEK